MLQSNYSIMTPEEKADFRQMEKDIQQLVINQEGNSRKLDEVLKAIKGDDFGNAGIVQRVGAVETDIKVLKESKTINGVYIKIITWLLAIIATGVVGFILQTVLKTKN